MGQRGIVVGKSGRKLTVLTNSGEFVTLRSSMENVFPGTEIFLPSSKEKSGSIFKRLVPAAVLASIMIVGSFFGYQHYLYAKPLMAYVTLDCTGSVELEVNEAGLVKSATPLNEAGQEALSKLQYQNRPADEVVESLVKVQSPQEGSEIIVAVVPVKESPQVDQLEKEVSGGATKSAEASVSQEAQDGSSTQPPKVTSFRLDMSTRESARKLGISAGRAALWALTGKIVDEQGSGNPSGTGTSGTQGSSEGPNQGNDHGGKPEQQSTTPKSPQTHAGGEGGSSGPDQGQTPASPSVKPGRSNQQLESSQAPSPGDGDSQSSEQESPLLKAIRSALPKVDPDEVARRAADTSKDAGKSLTEITKDWLQELSKEVSKHAENQSKKAGPTSSVDPQNRPGSPPGRSKDSSGRPKTSPPSHEK